MKLLKAIKRAFIGDPGDPTILDHVPTKAEVDWRDAKVKAAAVKLGRPFKCGPNGVPRERMVWKGADASVEFLDLPKASVTHIKRKTAQ
jgi:hypothetical protein